MHIVLCTFIYDLLINMYWDSLYKQLHYPEGTYLWPTWHSHSLLTSGGCGCRWSEWWFRRWCAVGSRVQEVAEPPPGSVDASTSPPWRWGGPLLRVLKPYWPLKVVGVQGWVRVQRSEFPALRTSEDSHTGTFTLSGTNFNQILYGVTAKLLGRELLTLGIFTWRVV